MVSLDDLKKIDWEERAKKQRREQDERDSRMAASRSSALLYMEQTRFEVERAVLSTVKRLEAKTKPSPISSGQNYRDEAFKNQFFRVRKKLTPPSGRRPTGEQISEYMGLPRSTFYDSMKRCRLKLDSENPDRFPD